MADYYVADFETTTPEREDVKDFTETEVWGAGLAPVGASDEKEVQLFGSIRDFLDACKKLPGRKPIIFFHNLKFDGMFLIYFLLFYMHFVVSKNPWKQERNELYPIISKDGMWYCVKVNYQGKALEFRDSLKLLPFTLDDIGNNLKTKHRKLVGSINYKKDRQLVWETRGGKWFKHYEMDEVEKKYLTNDILVLAEGLESIKKFGLLNYLTISACCYDDFKRRTNKDGLSQCLPQLTEEQDAIFRKAYHGGWCFVKNSGKEIHEHGYVYDVNSLYPYAMSSMDNHFYPIGEPHWFKGEDFEKYTNHCYFVRVIVDFEIKPNHLPFIQAKNSFYRDNEYLTDTRDEFGETHNLEFVFTRPDFELFLEQYDILYMEIVEGWWFQPKVGLFDTYINYWYDLKKNAPDPCTKVICKLHLNSLYGRLSQNPIRFSHVPYMEEEKIMFSTHEEHCKGGFIPVGAYITSWARCTTIRAAQANYDSFEYADTDSIHLTAPAKNIRVGKELGEWKLETEFSDAKFVRQKTYIEKTIRKDEKDCEPFWNIKACGCPDECKERMVYNINIYNPLTYNTNGVIINDRRTDEDFMRRFDIGLVESGKLLQKRIKGGVILVDSTFEIKPV